MLRAVRIGVCLMCVAAGGYLVAWSALALDYYVASAGCALLAPMRAPSIGAALLPVLGTVALFRFGPRLEKAAGATLAAGGMSMGLAALVMVLPH